jgi:hypothetical protein
VLNLNITTSGWLDPDMLHRPEAYSRYLDLHILPFSPADSTDT